jgi:membrane fusion protein (multidrug efflux system)
MHSKFKYSILIVVVLVACKAKVSTQAAAPPPAYVSVTTVKDTLAGSYDEYPAALAALNEVKLTPQVSGYITGVHFKDGDRVSKGQTLYTIDQQVYGANLQQAIANLQVQQTNLTKAQKDADRYHDLEQHDAIAKQQVDYADAALDAAKKQVSAAQANVNAVRANVGFAVIRAPFTGTIGISQVKAGTAVVAGQTILNTVSTDDPVAVDINVNQNDIFRFLKLQQQKQDRYDTTFTLYFNGERYDFPGKIYLIDRAVDPQTGTIKARLLFPNEKRMLKPGMNATVRVATNNSSTSIVIPFKAVTEQLGEYFTYVVGDSSKVRQQKVELGPQLGAIVVIRNGLQSGDRIVVEGVQNLHEGSVITTTPLQPQKK